MAEKPLIREIGQIERYSRHNEAENYRFRAFVKWRLNLSNEKLDAVVKETTAEVWEQIRCTDCGHCCRTLQILPDDQDIQRLATRLGMTVRQFSKRYVLVSETKEKSFPSPCPFLGEDNRCSVYEDRPQACRDYPYLYESDFRSRTLSVIENAEVCPVVFNVLETLKQRLHPKKRGDRGKSAGA